MNDITNGDEEKLEVTEVNSNATFFETFYETIEVMKTNISSFSGYIVAAAFIQTLTLMASGATDTPTIITIALIEVFIGTLIEVLFLNSFYSKLTDIEFSVRKSLWDYPTYIFYKLGFTLLFIIGSILLVIPGLLVAFFYSFSPIVAILFDSDDRGILSKTKQLVSKQYGLYACVFAIAIVVGSFDLASSQIVGVIGKGLFLIIPYSLILTLVSFASTALVVTFLQKMSQSHRC
ncbi:MAG: hypothetical protein BM556_12680 [Bacteriovorax sp. MedPE-SWde]|nr:MAG: hypothetical protein BM556_12680 [Bacteriovorax sp. MedPE-SWde]